MLFNLNSSKGLRDSLLVSWAKGVADDGIK